MQLQVHSKGQSGRLWGVGVGRGMCLGEGLCRAEVECATAHLGRTDILPEEGKREAAGLVVKFELLPYPRAFSRGREGRAAQRERSEQCSAPPTNEPSLDALALLSFDFIKVMNEISPPSLGAC